MNVSDNLICEVIPDFNYSQPYPNSGWNNQFDVGNDQGFEADGELSFTIEKLFPVANNMIGLDNDPLGWAGFQKMDYAFMMYKQGGKHHIRIYENGSIKVTSTANSIVGYNLKIKRTDGTIKYYINDAVVYTSSITSNDHLYYDNSGYQRTADSEFIASNIMICKPGPPDIDTNSQVPIDDFVLSGQYYSNEVILRWVPKTYDAWEEGMNRGYTINRYILGDDGGAWAPIDQLASKVTVETNLKPVSNDNWNSASFPDENTAQAAQHLLYSEEFNPSFAPSSFQEVVNINDTKANRYTFSLMVADRYFELANAMGLGFKDLSYNGSNTYRYSLSYADAPETSIAECIVDLLNPKEIEKVQNVKTVGADKLAVLEWDINHSSRYYTSYNIERSTNGITFDNVNEMPFIYGVDGNSTANPGKAYYRDSLPANGVEYQYRIVGLSPFGIQGPASDPISCTGIPGRMDLTMSIAILSEETTEVTIIWGGIDADQEQQIDRFEVYRSTDIYDGFEKINNQNLNPSDRLFIDTSPLYSGYYVITMYDVNGHYYKSRALLAQPSDETPPEVPTGLAGEIDEKGKASLGWSSNYEADFQGYRVFRSNLRTGNFIEISKEDIETNEYVDYLSTEMMTDSVFYTVKSSDIRGNHSEFSEVLAFARPNTIPPSRALLHNLMPTNEGVKVSWVLSESSDVQNHILQRKPRDGSGWMDVVTIEIGSPLASQELGENLMKYNYLDDDELESIYFQYRLIASDQSGNTSISNMLEVRPITYNEYGEITEFQGNYQCSNSNEVTSEVSSLQQVNQALSQGNNGGSGNAQAILLDMLTQGIITYDIYAQILNSVQSNSISISQAVSNQINELSSISNAECIVFLNWEYKRDLDATHVDVYRAEGDEAMDLYRTYRAEELVINQFPEMGLVDRDIVVKKRYRYKIVVHLKDGKHSPVSEEVVIVII